MAKPLPSPWHRDLQGSSAAYTLQMYHYPDRAQMQFDFLRKDYKRPFVCANVSVADAKKIVARLTRFIRWQSARKQPKAARAKKSKPRAAHAGDSK